MLRIVTFLGLTLLATSALAQSEVGSGDFADGAFGEIDVPVMEMLRDARERGEELRKGLDILDPDDYGVDVDTDMMRERALNDPRVRALLNAQSDGPNNGEQYDAFGERKAFLFLSFSMPPMSLRKAMEEAERHGVAVAFRGFLNNSVFDTQDALTAVFGKPEDSLGFGIDPTLFTRFGVETVPQLVVLKEPLQPCVMQGCVGEGLPTFDLVRGNVPIEYALQEIIRGEGEATLTALVLLKNAEEDG